MTDDELNDLSDPDHFEFDWPLWVVGRYPPPADAGESIRSIRQVLFESPDGRPGRAVAVFTDYEAAEEFVASLPGRGEWKPVRYEPPQTFCLLLRELVKIGNTAVAFDPRPDPRTGSMTSPNLVPIPEVVDALNETHGDGLAPGG